MPRISVVTPVYNGAQFIADTIRSVMAQTFADWEHIVVDDCSTDDTVEVIGRFSHVRLLRLDTNGGPARALNHGYARASGELYAWVSADDGYLPTYLERAVAYLDEHPDAVCVDAGAYFVDVDGNILKAHNVGERPTVRPYDILRRNPIHGSSTLFHRRVYEQLGGFDERLIGTPDTDMWVRMCTVGRIGHIPDPVTYATRHEKQDSRVRSHLLLENLQALIDRSVETSAPAALLPNPNGDGNGSAAQAAGWYEYARAFASTVFYPLAPEYVRRARRLDRGNLTYRLQGALLTPVGAATFRVRSRIAPYAVRLAAERSRKAGRNVHRMNAEALGDRALEAPAA